MTQENRRSQFNIFPKLLREARTRERDSKWLSSAPGVILRKHRGKYVAVKNRKILASSQTMKRLYAKIDRLDPGMVLITRIEKPTLLI